MTLATLESTNTSIASSNISRANKMCPDFSGCLVFDISLVSESKGTYQMHEFFVVSQQDY